MRKRAVNKKTGSYSGLYAVKMLSAKNRDTWSDERQTMYCHRTNITVPFISTTLPFLSDPLITHT